jgi:hypothetical protein
MKKNSDELALLREIRDAVHHLCRLMESQVDNRRPSPAAIAKLLKETRRASQDLPFSVSDVTLHAGLKLADDPALYNAITGVLGVFSTRRLGSVFASIEGQAFDGLTIQRNGKKGRDGQLWSVVTFPDSKSSH